MPFEINLPSRPPRGLKESSQNLDMDELGPVLRKLAACVQGGFGASEIAEVVGVAEQMRPEQTRTFRFPIRASAMWVRIVMDDIDSLDLEVHADSHVLRRLNKLTPIE